MKRTLRVVIAAGAVAAGIGLAASPVAAEPGQPIAHVYGRGGTDCGVTIFAPGWSGDFNPSVANQNYRERDCGMNIGVRAGVIKVAT